MNSSDSLPSYKKPSDVYLILRIKKLINMITKNIELRKRKCRTIFFCVISKRTEEHLTPV